MEILRVENLSKTYGKGDSMVRALDGVSFSVNKGEFISIIGPSGSGKSTLLHILGGVDKPTDGTVYMDGQDVYAMNDEQLAVFRRRQVGLIYQFYNLIPVLNVTENIYLPALMDGREVNRERLSELITTLRLEGREKHLPNQLSGGQQQRVALARMLASEPNILMLDEPFSALDQFLKERTLPSILKIIERTGKTALLVTHNMDEAYMFCPRIAVMSDGHIDTMGTRREVFQNPTTKAAARLTGVKNITAIEKVSENVFTSLDWGATLHCSQNLTAGHTYAGIRAHFLKIRRDSVENSIPCIVEQVLSTRFTKTVMLKPQNSSLGNIRIDADKELSERYIEIGENVFAEFPEDEIMLLR